MSDLLRGELARVAATLGADGIDFVLERPRDAGHGDLATNLAMVLARQQRSQAPRPSPSGSGRAASPSRRRRPHRDRGARVHQLLAGGRPARRGASPHPRRGSRLRTLADERAAQGQRRVRLRQPHRPSACRPWPRRRTGRRDRRAARVDRPQRHPRVLYQRRGRADRPGWPRACGRGSARRPGDGATIPEGGYHGEYLQGDRRATCWRGKDVPSPTCPSPKAFAGARAWALRIQREEQDHDLAAFGVRFDVMSSEQALYDRGKVERALSPARRTEPDLRGRGRPLAPHHRLRRR